MKKLSLTVIVLVNFVHHLSIAQFSKGEQLQIDSLNTIINTKTNHDTSIARAYVGLSEILYVIKLDTIIPLCENAINIAEQALAGSNLSPIVKRALFFSMAESYNNIGYVYNGKGDIKNALSNHFKSLKIREELNDKSGIANSFNNIGYIYQKKGDIENALDYFHKSIKYREELQDKKGLAVGYNNLGSLYDTQTDIKNALIFYNKSLDSYTELNDNKGVGISLSNIANIYKQEGNLEKALTNYYKSIEILEKLHISSGLATSLNNIALVYELQGDIQKTLLYHTRSLKIYEKLGVKIGQAASNNNIGVAMIKAGKLDSAEYYIKKGLKIAQELGSPKWISESSINLSTVEKKLGNYKEALEMYELHILMRDSINNEKTQKATIRQQTKYEFEKAQLVAEQLRKEELRVINEKLKRRDNLQYSIILVAILAVFGFVLALGKINVSPKVAEGLIFFAFLIFFEFLLVLSDPYVDGFTAGEPMYKLLANALLAGLIFPLHSFFEKVLKERLIKKQNVT